MMLIKTSSKAQRSNKGFTGTIVLGETAQKAIAINLTIVVSAVTLATLWMIDPALVKTFTGHLEAVLPVYVDYYLRS